MTKKTRDFSTLATANAHYYLDHLDRRVSRVATVTIKYPSELKAFEDMTPGELIAAAARHDLKIVPRAGGSKLEFYRLA